MITVDNLSPQENSASQLVDAIWATYRENRRDLHASVAALLNYDDPVVREEALSLLLVKWTDKRYRNTAVTALTHDRDWGVRGRAAIGLAAVSDSETRADDIRLLLQTLHDEQEEPATRRASYEALLLLHGRNDFPSHASSFNPQQDIDWDWISRLQP